jgi:DNA helicase-2/ATP-dependent DNA helicase PcrA
MDVDAESRAIRRALAEMDDIEGDCDIDIGDRVRHAKFGLGTVAAIKGSGAQAKITVDFSSAGRRVLAAEFARLSRA